MESSGAGDVALLAWGGTIILQPWFALCRWRGIPFDVRMHSANDDDGMHSCLAPQGLRAQPRLGRCCTRRWCEILLAQFQAVLHCSDETKVGGIECSVNVVLHVKPAMVGSLNHKNKKDSITLEVVNCTWMVLNDFQIVGIAPLPYEIARRDG